MITKYATSVKCDKEVAVTDEVKRQVANSFADFIVDGWDYIVKVDKTGRDSALCSMRIDTVENHDRIPTFRETFDKIAQKAFKNAMKGRLLKEASQGFIKPNALSPNEYSYMN